MLVSFCPKSADLLHDALIDWNLNEIYPSIDIYTCHSCMDSCILLSFGKINLSINHHLHYEDN